MLVSEFKGVEKEWSAHRDELRRKQREEYQRKKEEEHRQQVEEYEKDLAEYEASREPFEDERQLCQTLIAYLHRFKLSESSLESQDSISSACSLPGSVCCVFWLGSVLGFLPVDGGSDVAPAEGMYILRKKSSEDLTWAAGKANKQQRKSRRDRRKTLNKPITHSAQIFAQFAQLGLSAPSNVSEVSASVQQLEAKHVSYQRLSLRLLHQNVSFRATTDLSSCRQCW
jgi:hypothetical protein